MLFTSRSACVLHTNTFVLLKACTWWLKFTTHIHNILRQRVLICLEALHVHKVKRLSLSLIKVFDCFLSRSVCSCFFIFNSLSFSLFLSLCPRLFFSLEISFIFTQWIYPYSLFLPLIFGLPAMFNWPHAHPTVFLHLLTVNLTCWWTKSAWTENRKAALD